jgi:hypothetical protein
MKRMFFVLTAIVLTSVTLFTSCTNDTTDPDLPPSISFLAADTLISSNATVTVGETFHIGVNCVANATSESKIKSLRVTRITNNQMILDQTENYNDPSITVIASFEALNEPGTETIEFTVTDADGQSAKKSVEITTEDNSVEVQKWTNITLGSYNDPIGSFFATTTGKVMTVAEGTANPAIVDFAFFLGATNGSSIASPIDDILLEFIDFAPVENWNPRNDTRLIYPAPINANEFNSIGTSYSFPTFNTASSVTLANQLSVNNVIYFKTAAGKLGFIKINSINGRGDKANIDVIVEK